MGRASVHGIFVKIGKQKRGKKKNKKGDNC